MDPVAKFNEADEIARKILAKQSVSEDEFRYVVMFNLTAMTQLLWELSNSQLDQSKSSLRPTRTRSGLQSSLSGVKNKVERMAAIAAIAAFLAGLGLGYLIP